MNSTRVTPLILTWNEEANIERCLKRLEWTPEVIIIDSGSTDRTLEICKQFPNVTHIHNPFKSFAEQANFGLSKIQTDWVLTLDADYILPLDFEQELKAFELADNLSAAYASFDYCVFGTPLRGTLYPPRPVLHRVKEALYVQIGHTQRLQIAGRKMDLGIRIEHDDRKPLSRWFATQAIYARQEAELLLAANPSTLSRQDRLRLKVWIAPWLIAFWCLVVNRCALDGYAGLYYTFQRMIVETMLAVCILDARLRGGKR